MFVQKNLFPSHEMIVSPRETFHTEQREEDVRVEAEADGPHPGENNALC